MKRDEEVQADLFKADVSWFHIFKEIIRNGTWAKLSTNAKSLYPVVKAFINWESGSAFPSIDTLEAYSGISRPSIVKALKELEKDGLLVKTTTKGKGSNYTLVEKFNVKDGDGRPAASVSFDYLPSHVTDAVAELRNFMAQGLTLPDGKTNFIKIDSLTLNIHSGSGNNITNNIRGGMDEATLMKGIRDIANKNDSAEALLVAEMAKNYSTRDKDNNQG
jgi:biotin operon repressor